MRKLLMIIIGTCMGYAASAQQIPLFSQYMFNKLIINPGYAGNYNVVNNMLTYRSSFTGFDGAPVTQTLTSHAPIPGKSMGVGLKILNDKIGVTNQTHVAGIYAYQMGFGPGKLSMGIEAGIINTKIDFLTVLQTANDPVDAAAPASVESKMVPDAAFGIWYNTTNFFGGMSIQQLISSKLDYTGVSRDIIAKIKQHYLLTAGYAYEMGDNFAIEPSFLLKAVGGAPVQLDLNARFIFKRMVSLGTSYRTGDGLAIIAEFNYNDEYRIGYAYDLTLSDFKNHQNGSHEIMFNYNLKLPEPPRKKTIDPRYYY